MAAERIAGPVRRPEPLPLPQLVDGSVVLRAWRPADAGALASAWADPEIQRWTGVPDDRSAEAAERWIVGEAQRRRRRVALDLVIASVDDDRVLGEVGLGPIQWDRGRAMIGYWLAAGERGKGHAVGAVGMLVDWALVALELDRIVAETDVENPASGRVLQVNGFEQAVQRGNRQVWMRSG